MVKQVNKERRQFIRAKRVLSIQFSLHKSNRKNVDKTAHLSTTHDMSVGGLTFYTDQEFKTGDVLNVHVMMSGMLDIFKGKGRVKRVERRRNAAHYLVAIQFLDNPPQKRSAKRHVIKRKKTKVKKRI